VPEQLFNRLQIDSGHNKSTGKRMAVAMPPANASGTAVANVAVTVSGNEAQHFLI
jgi:hypothetical protein